MSKKIKLIDFYVNVLPLKHKQVTKILELAIKHNVDGKGSLIDWFTNSGLFSGSVTAKDVIELFVNHSEFFSELVDILVEFPDDHTVDDLWTDDYIMIFMKSYEVNKKNFLGIGKKIGSLIMSEVGSDSEKSTKT